MKKTEKIFKTELSKWAYENNVSNIDLAYILCLHPTYSSQIANGRTPSAKTREAVRLLMTGEINFRKILKNRDKAIDAQ